MELGFWKFKVHGQKGGGGFSVYAPCIESAREANEHGQFHFFCFYATQHLLSLQNNANDLLAAAVGRKTRPSHRQKL